jgi:hypothetical protein
VTTHSGGTDAIIAILEVVSSCPLSMISQLPAQGALTANPPLIGPNPTRGRFIFRAPAGGAKPSSAAIFDLGGRRVALLRSRPGLGLAWDGTDESGRAVPPGIYLYRVDFGKGGQDGKIVVVR